MNEKELIEVVEYISEGRITRKTINGIEVPPELLSPLPTVVVQKLYMTKEEVKKVYGKWYV